MTLYLHSFNIHFWYQYVFNVHWWHNKLTNLSISPPSDDTVRSNKISSISIGQCNGFDKGVGHVNCRTESQDADISFIQTSSSSIAWVLQKRYKDLLILLFKKETAFRKVALENCLVVFSQCIIITMMFVVHWVHYSSRSGGNMPWFTFMSEQLPPYPSVFPWYLHKYENDRNKIVECGRRP